MKQTKTVLITGAGSGIGKYSAIALAKLGYHVLATTHFETQAEELNKLAKMDGLSLESFKLDVTQEIDREKILKYDIDVLINNAGIGESGSLAEINVDLIRKNFETNLFSSIELTQLALKGMIKRDHGKIIFVSSLAGRISVMPFLSPYGMTKYKWMDESSYFYNKINQIKKDEERQFHLTEVKSIKSIVNKIVKVCESDKPRFRYSAPWWQSVGVRLLRIVGK